jgi:hypothetical protein
MKLLSIHRLSVSGFKLPVLPAILAAIFPAILPVILSVQILASTLLHSARAEEAPVPLIFDTDMGNDCDDALALAMIHALQSRKECELLAVTITKDHELAAPFVDCLNTFYGRGNIPIGVCRNSGKTPDAGKYNQVSKITDNGKLRFEHDLLSGNNAPTAVEVLRRTLAQAQDDRKVKAVLVRLPEGGLTPAAADEIRSVGAKFIELDLESLEGAGGYAREMTEERSQRQRDLLTPFISAADAVITTAAVPGRQAPPARRPAPCACCATPPPRPPRPPAVLKIK